MPRKPLYNTEKLKQQAIEAIKNHKLFFIEDVAAYLPCHKDTFYQHIPVESDDRKEIDELLEHNKVEVKVSMRSKWYKSDAPLLQLALYKIITTEEERKRLSMQAVQHSGEIKGSSIVINHLGKTEIDPDAI